MGWHETAVSDCDMIFNDDSDKDVNNILAFFFLILALWRMAQNRCFYV